MAIAAPIRLSAWEHNFVRLRTVQGEDQSRKIEASLFERDNVPLNMEGYTASMYIEEANGRKVTQPATIDGNLVTAVIPYLESAGHASVQICLSKSESEMLKIAGIVLEVIPSDLEGAAEGSDEWNQLAALIGDAEEAIAGANAAAVTANNAAEDVKERADSGEFDGASGTIDNTTATTLTGLLKGDGSTVTAATAGTDYVTPAGLSSELSAYLPKSGGSIEGPLVPAQYDSISLGSSGMPWSAVHASVFDGDSAQISGTVYSEGMEVSGTIRPAANNGGGLGDASRYFGTAYIGTVNARLASVTGKIYSEGKEVWTDAGIESATFTIAGGSPSKSYTMRMQKLGRMVIVGSGDWISFEGIAHNATVGSIPAGYRPLYPSYAAVIDRGGYFLLKFYTDGSVVVQVQTGQTSFYGYMANICYMTA